MAKRIKAKLPWHVVATGYSGNDFKAIGRGDVFLQEDFTEDDVSWHPTFNAAMEHPAAREGYGSIRRMKTRKEIDGLSGMDITKNRLAKATEAEKVIFEGVTGPPERIPFLTADCNKRKDGCTLMEVAQEVWLKYAEDAEPEADRVQEKREV